ncbi:MAG: hypothetical protein K8H88_21545, partial [Sandaracinaceae bacterium]|nr:hypothetical protein [Sandaracinaceae bacterium]
MALRKFALGAAGGYRGRDGGETFARDLIECFWPAAGEQGEGPVFSHAVAVVDGGKRSKRTLSAYWPARRVVVEVVDRDMMLDLAWNELLRACLQMEAEPQYVVLTNQRDVRLYDLARERNEPRLSIAIDELPKYSEAFSFFEPDWVPGTTPKIINVDKVSREVADLVAKTYRALKAKHPKRGEDVIRFTLQCPTGSGTDILTNKIVESPDYVVWLADCLTEQEAEGRSPTGLRHLRERVYPTIAERAADPKATSDWRTWAQRWWRPQKARDSFRAATAQLARWTACVRVQTRPIFFLLSTHFVPSDSLQLFAYDDDYSFGVIQSSLHWEWTKAKGGRLKSDIRYTSNVWKTFPWPQEPTLDDVVAVAQAAQQLRATRQRLMDDNGWSLRDLYRSAEVEGPHPLKDAQAALDAAVEAAYGKPADQEATEFLLEMNLALAEDEANGIAIQGPGLPKVNGKDLDPKDPRWFSTDCIEPPPLPGGDAAPSQGSPPSPARAKKKSK